MPQTHQSEVWENELIRFNFFVGNKIGEERERSLTLKFQKVDKISYLAAESSWQRRMLMHPTPVCRFIHLIRSYRLQNKPNETECAEKTPVAPAAMTILPCASVWEGPKAPPRAATDTKSPCWLQSTGSGDMAKRGSKTWCSSRHPAKWALYNFTQFSSFIPPIPKR